MVIWGTIILHYIASQFLLLLLFVQENFEASDRQKVLDVITSPGVVPVGSEGYMMMSGGFTCSSLPREMIQFD